MGTELPNSDIDIVVILKENLNKISVIFQYVGNVPADFFLYDKADLDKLLSAKEISGNSSESMLVDWLPIAKIQFDKSGLVSSLIKQASLLKSKFAIPVSEKQKWEALINATYTINKRYFESKEPMHMEALEVKMLYDISYVLTAYFEFRDITYRGEKLMVKYLKENDPSFHDLYMSCVRASTIEERFRIYSQLVKLAFHGGYKMWDKNIINPYTKVALEPEQREHLVDYWRKLSS
jgi:hypothetical protein